MEKNKIKDVIPKLDLNDKGTVMLLSKNGISAGDFADIFYRLLPQGFGNRSLQFWYDSDCCAWRGQYTDEDGTGSYACCNVMPEEAARGVLYKLISDGIVKVVGCDGIMRNGEKYIAVPASYNVCSACHFPINRCGNICQAFNNGDGVFFIRPGKKRNDGNGNE